MTKRLYRSQKDKVIAGVAGGVAEYLNIDPVLVRIGFIVTTFMGGFGFLTYIIAWIVIPEGPVGEPMQTPTDSTTGTTPPQQEFRRERDRRGSVVGGLVLIVMGSLFLADNFLPHFRVWDYWPLIFVAVGAGLLWKSVRPNNT
ncbi:MAG: PspC domain-containing protein [Ignavibacteriales bacterium]|nr:PspC domain-containing protein [Ignavibacteriales bacterium]